MDEISTAACYWQIDITLVGQQETEIACTWPSTLASASLCEPYDDQLYLSFQYGTSSCDPRDDIVSDYGFPYWKKWKTGTGDIESEYGFSYCKIYKNGTVFE